MTVYTDDDERRVKIELMQADIEHKHHDMAYKQGLLRFEPWKLVIAGLAAGGIIFGALGYKLGSTPPPPIVIQLPPSNR